MLIPLIFFFYSESLKKDYGIKAVYDNLNKKFLYNEYLTEYKKKRFKEYTEKKNLKEARYEVVVGFDSNTTGRYYNLNVVVYSNSEQNAE